MMPFWPRLMLIVKELNLDLEQCAVVKAKSVDAQSRENNKRGKRLMGLRLVKASQTTRIFSGVVIVTCFLALAVGRRVPPAGLRPRLVAPLCARGPGTDVKASQDAAGDASMSGHYRRDGVRIQHDPYAPGMAEKYGRPGETDDEGFDPYAGEPEMTVRLVSLNARQHLCDQQSGCVLLILAWHADSVGPGIYGGKVKRDDKGNVIIGKQFQNHNPMPGPVYAGGGYTAMSKALSQVCRGMPPPTFPAMHWRGWIRRRARSDAPNLECAQGVEAVKGLLDADPSLVSLPLSLPPSPLPPTGE